MIFSSDDLHLFNEGTHERVYEKLGARLASIDGKDGAYFSVWAPNASEVSLIGDFNGWDGSEHQMLLKGNSGIWEIFVPGLGSGTIYKFRVVSSSGRDAVEKADPFAFHAETPPKSASVLWDLAYDWQDLDWMKSRKPKNALAAPISIYELHLGSWKRGEDGRWLSYRELAQPLADYLRKMNFTHVELMPVMEHPYYGSWGYQLTGYYAASSRYGTPQDLMFLIDTLHQNGIGVILDWVPSHFAVDGHGLALFDGTHLFEHADPKKGFHPDWKSGVFNYGRNEVRSFLISNALFWIEKYHADGLRLDAVASMLYLDYSRKAGEWIANDKGGRENTEAVSFLQELNAKIYKNHPDVQTFAEESTAWPQVSRPVDSGGLGFGFKWDMGWMHDSLDYLKHDPIHRQYHHRRITFRLLYAFNENFVLPLSHDEVVHGKGSLLRRMAGDDWQKFANLRLLFAHQYAQPGKKFVFMGGEFGQWNEWYHETSLDWNLLGQASHAGAQRWLEDLNRLYRDEKALHELDCDSTGFEWIDCDDAAQGVLSLLRKSSEGNEQVLAVFNFTPVPRENYRLGVPRAGLWKELLNSDAAEYGGSGHGNLGSVKSEKISYHNRPHSIKVFLPGLSALFFRAPNR